VIRGIIPLLALTAVLNGTTPPASATATDPVQAPSSRHLVLDRNRRLLTVLDGEEVLHRFPVAVGMAGWETPVGRFTVIQKLSHPTWEHPETGKRIPPGPSNPLGSRWIGFHRDCEGRKRLER
jgi:L,D-transpeptidase ErfK/SrfK